MQKNKPINHRTAELVNFLSKQVPGLDQGVKARLILKNALLSLRDVVSADTGIKILTLLPPHLKPIFTYNWKFSSHPDCHQNPDAFIQAFKERCEQDGMIFSNNDARALLQQVGLGLVYALPTLNYLEMRKTIPIEFQNLLFTIDKRVYFQ